MVIEKGDIWWAELPNPAGSEPGYRRPLLIIQSDAFNNSNIQTTICAVLSSNIKLAKAPGNILITKQQSALPKDSVINISQILTVDKSIFTEKVGKLSRKLVQKVNDSIEVVFNL